MGTSIQWYSELKDNKVSFPEFCYGVNFNETNKETVTKGEWTWETGMNKNQITEAEKSETMDFWLFTLTGVFEESFCRKEKIQQSFLGVGGVYRGQARVTPSFRRLRFV